LAKQNRNSVLSEEIFARRGKKILGMVGTEGILFSLLIVSNAPIGQNVETDLFRKTRTPFVF